MKCLLAVIPLDNYKPLLLKHISTQRQMQGANVYGNKSIALETHPPKGKYHRDSTRRNGSPSSAQLYQRKETFSSKTAMKM